VRSSARSQLALPMTIKQKVRRAVLLITFLTFPVTFYYLSPYIIINGAIQGIIVGSFIYFGLLFLFSCFSVEQYAGGYVPPPACRSGVLPLTIGKLGGKNKMDNVLYLGSLDWDHHRHGHSARRI